MVLKPYIVDLAQISEVNVALLLQKVREVLTIGNVVVVMPLF